jgi:hypothetical protein
MERGNRLAILTEESGMKNKDQEVPSVPDLQHKGEPQPQCPKCAVTGADYIVSKKGGTSAARGKQFILAPFNIIFCSECGHVYGITGISS